MNKGKIVQVMGPVVDVIFENGELPAIKDALAVENNGKKSVMEVSQHIGNDTVRCIMLSASEGLCRDMEVTATGAGIKVPVGDKTLGRLFNVLGDTIDGGESLEDEEHWEILRHLKNRVRLSRFLRPESKSLIFLHLMQREERSVCSEEPVSEKPC